jgi:3-methyl-2-oxobutanoate hydroxymethyltransferase
MWRKQPRDLMVAAKGLSHAMQTTVQDIRRAKDAGEPLVMLTAYDYPSAALAERAGVRLLLVGDSLGMVVQGHGTTLPVTLDAMVYHTAAVARGASAALVVADLPFLTYATPADAVAAARRLMQEGGAHAVKLEGGQAMAATIRHLTELGVPVMGHIGFTPQAQHQLGLRVQGKQAAEAARLLQDGCAVEAAGAFAIVLELVPSPLATAITQRLSIPTIGIGAGPGCDGQVQVWHDVLGLYPDANPRHAKRYAQIGDTIQAALSAYAADVRAGAFPTARNGSSMKDDELAAALGQAGEKA